MAAEPQIKKEEVAGKPEAYGHVLRHSRHRTLTPSQGRRTVIKLLKEPGVSPSLLAGKAIASIGTTAEGFATPIARLIRVASYPL